MRISTKLALLCGFLILLVLAVSGCASTKETGAGRVEFQQANVAVAVGCVKDRPEPVQPLNKRVSSETWQSLAPGAKAQAVLAQAGERMNYQDELEASVAGCGPAK